MIKINKNDDELLVSSPYNSKFIAGARKIGGKWKAPHWVFDSRDEQFVRGLLLKWYGSDGTFSDTVTAKVDFAPGEYADKAPIELFGRTIARAYGRDSGAVIGDGVVVLDGGFTSGGSAKNWETCAGKYGATVLVRDVPRAKAEEVINSGGKWLTIVDEKKEQLQKLREEKAALIKRIAEIDKLIDDEQR